MINRVQLSLAALWMYVRTGCRHQHFSLPRINRDDYYGKGSPYLAVHCVQCAARKDYDLDYRPLTGWYHRQPVPNSSAVTERAMPSST